MEAGLGLEGPGPGPDPSVISLSLLLLLLSAGSGSAAERHGAPRRPAGRGLEALRHYDLLSLSHMEHRISRRDVAEGPRDRTVSFQALGRKFVLHLSARRGLLTDSARVLMQDAWGEVKPLPLNTHGFYSGYVQGDSNSSVQAYIGEGEFSARILTSGDEYHVEPLWRLAGDPEDERMVVYRGDALQGSHAPFCATRLPRGAKKGGEQEGRRPGEHPGQQFGSTNSGEAMRPKRSAAAGGPVGAMGEPVKDTCTLLLVADFRFFQAMGRGQQGTTINYLIELVDRVDGIFRGTHWGEQAASVGIQIQEILIHEESTVVVGGERHYNMEAPPSPITHGLPSPPSLGTTSHAWNVSELLRQFSMDVSERASQVCLAHLFTYQDFEDGILGLAYVASPTGKTDGGVCSKRTNPRDPGRVQEKNGINVSYNTGLTSTMNYGKTILTKEVELVVAHELGHSFGAGHDTEECSAGHDADGKYIMYPIAVSGDQPNNGLFSPCSVRSVGQVLSHKAASCLTPQRHKYCGNFRVEDGEQCDEGPPLGRNHSCCTHNCTLRENALCSDRNSPCCQGCRYKDQVLCQGRLPALCREAAFCTGDSGVCPKPGNLSDGTECLDHGRCLSGVCQPFCTTLEQKLEPCVCAEKNDSCKVCCRRPGGGCAPYLAAGGSPLLLPRGKPCSVGFCDIHGQCIKQVQDFLERTWDFIEKLNANELSRFLADNVVGSVLIFSVLLWVPLSLLVHCVDRNLDNEYSAGEHWPRPGQVVEQLSADSLGDQGSPGLSAVPPMHFTFAGGGRFGSGARLIRPIKEEPAYNNDLPLSSPARHSYSDLCSMHNRNGD
uniref:Disintegrin and metalloproteinase domain-containing protein 17-like isoform X1 n=1 Tax=Petromyzon marinus TaxID=7757 RepID=A0AAJ7WVP9_PETMA|nr:disintegrin and metalloproteinase domain-containing protein 17-like isoform X1 [Petromyzon marinus]